MKLLFKPTVIALVLGAINTSCHSEPSVLLQQPEVAINDTLQHIVDEAMEKPVADRNPDWACAILLNKEGQVVALFDTDSAQSHINQDMRVGGILKPFTIMGALMTDSIDSTTLYPVSKKGILWSKSLIKDGHPMDTVLTVQDIIAVSSNIGEFEILSNVYRHTDTLMLLNEYMQALGINTHADSHLDLLRCISQGELTTSPLHLAWLYHCLAQNLLPEEWHDAATVVREGMHEVVWNKIGSAGKLPWTYGAQSDKVHIMGKTGGVLIDREQRKCTISFCGIFPKEDPQYTCLIMISNPSYPFSLRMDCAAPVRKIAEQLITHKLTH
jgi:cell division protein FtsI (penicillin-binding protein 3)